MNAQPLTDHQLDEIEARAAAATPGPWKRKAELASHIVYVDSPDGTFSVLWNAEWATDADGEFTAHARKDVPALLAEVRRLQDKARELGELAARREAELIALRPGPTA